MQERGCDGQNDIRGHGGGGRMESIVCVEGLAFAKSRSMLSVWPEIRRRWAWMLVAL